MDSEIQNNMCEWSDVSISVSYHYKDPIKRVGLVQSGYHHYHITISLNATCSCHNIAEKLFIWGEATIIHSLTHLNIPKFSVKQTKRFQIVKFTQV